MGRSVVTASVFCGLAAVKGRIFTLYTLVSRALSLRKDQSLRLRYIRPLESTPRAAADVKHFDQLLLFHDAEYRTVDVWLVAVE